MLHATRGCIAEEYEIDYFLVQLIEMRVPEVIKPLFEKYRAGDHTDRLFRFCDRFCSGRGSTIRVSGRGAAKNALQASAVMAFLSGRSAAGILTLPLRRFCASVLHTENPRIPRATEPARHIPMDGRTDRGVLNHPGGARGQQRSENGADFGQHLRSLVHIIVFKCTYPLKIPMDGRTDRGVLNHPGGAHAVLRLCPKAH